MKRRCGGSFPYINKIKVDQFGLGPIGIEAFKLAVERPWPGVVGGVDIDPELAGRAQ